MNFKSLSCDVCAIVTLLLATVTVNSCASPTMIPESVSTVSAPVVVSAASALRKLPPAITVLEVFDVPDTIIEMPVCLFLQTLLPVLSSM